MKRVVIGAIGAVFALSAAGCSSSDPVADASASVSEASSSYCAQLATTENAVSALAATATNSNSSVDELKSQRATVKEDLQTLATEAENLDSVQKAANETLVNAYDAAVQSIPEDATLSEAGTQLETATTALAASLKAVAKSANCS